MVIPEFVMMLSILVFLLSNIFSGILFMKAPAYRNYVIVVNAFSCSFVMLTLVMEVMAAIGGDWGRIFSVFRNYPILIVFSFVNMVAQTMLNKKKEKENN